MKSLRSRVSVGKVFSSVGVTLLTSLVFVGCGGGTQVANNQTDVNAELEAARQADEFCQWVSQFNTEVAELNSNFLTREGDVSIEEYGEIADIYQDGANRFNAAGYSTIGVFSQTMADLYGALKSGQENPDVVLEESPSDIMLRVLREVETINSDVDLIDSRCGVRLSEESVGEVEPVEPATP